MVQLPGKTPKILQAFIATIACVRVPRRQCTFVECHIAAPVARVFGQVDTNWERARTFQKSSSTLCPDRKQLVPSGNVRRQNYVALNSTAHSPGHVAQLSLACILINMEKAREEA